MKIPFPVANTLAHAAAAAAVFVSSFAVVPPPSVTDSASPASLGTQPQLVVPASPSAEEARRPNVPGFQRKPDLYVMAMTYQPEFCFLHKDYPGCQIPPDEYWKTHLTIHGLWPEYNDGTFPAMCSAEKLQDATIAPLRAQLDLFWPNLKEPDPSSPKHNSFWKYEWNKHGTCSGLPPRDYLESALLFQTPTPLEVQREYGKRITKQQLVQSYGGSDRAVPICLKGRFLEEVRTCLGVGPDGKPTGPVPCPKSIVEQTNCGDDIVLGKFPSVASASVPADTGTAVPVTANGVKR